MGDEPSEPGEDAMQNYDRDDEDDEYGDGIGVGFGDVGGDNHASAAPTATPTATPTARPPRHATSADDIDGTSGPIIVNYLPIQTIQRLRHQDLMSLGKSMGVGNIMRMNTKRKATRAVEMHLFNAFDHEHWVNIKIVLDFTNPLCNKPIIFCLSPPNDRTTTFGGLVLTMIDHPYLRRLFVNLGLNADWIINLTDNLDRPMMREWKVGTTPLRATRSTCTGT